MERIEDLRVADIYVAQTLRFWCLHPPCIRACSAVEEGGATHRTIHRSEDIVQKGVVRVVMVKRWSIWFH